MVDAGYNLFIAVNTDLDGQPRKVDIPSVPDIGAGTPPIVDMGAYEMQGIHYQIYLPVVIK